MPPIRDYYEVLGVSPEAAPEEIKKSYRRLVRKYHPDVNQDKKAAARIFIQVTEAYHVLSDPGRKRSYDLTRAASRQAAQQRATSRPAAGPAGTARTTSGAPSSGTRPHPHTARPAGARPGRAGTQTLHPAVEKLLKDAEFAFIRGRLAQAENICHTAVRTDRKAARAYTILGDIYQARGLRDRALEQYSYAIQFDPTNPAVQAKLERLIGTGFRPPRPGAPRNATTAEAKGAFALLGSVVGWSCFFLVFFWTATIHASTRLVASANVPDLLQGWNWQITAALCAAGLLLGIMLRSGGVLGHHGDELMFQTITRGARRPGSLPVGLLLLGLACVCVWVAFAYSALAGLLLESSSRNLTRAFLGTLAYVLAAAIVASGLHLQVLLFGGNLVFLTLVAGWWMTDATADSFQRGDAGFARE